MSDDGSVKQDVLGEAVEAAYSHFCDKVRDKTSNYGPFTNADWQAANTLYNVAKAPQDSRVPRPAALRALAEQFDDPKSPPIALRIGKFSRTPGYLLRRIADALEPQKEKP